MKLFNVRNKTPAGHLDDNTSPGSACQLVNKLFARLLICTGTGGGLM